MADPHGKIVLMGSGELTATMVEVHKGLLQQLPGTPRAVFLDTPAGFQLNVDQISTRAADYFQTHVRHPLAVASFKSNTPTVDYDRLQANRLLRQADFVLIGPGSPTYAVRQWEESPVPDLLARCVTAGGCLVAASAAALTVGRFTLPVYEIYKVGQDLHWVDGLNLLGRFGLNLVVVPHWNNAEGGTHDTRFCFMGATRFEALAAMLPQALPVLGLDEHTACILDLASDQAEVKGIGGITLRTSDGVMTVPSGSRFSLSVFRQG
ncbi:Type 1 glutamine amidotransferase-like domain-containing protein [Desulfosarcina sp.]|uniref:Type 1 glutamine amidotransferase-like domain-containing protein n=1 Tax=Desulfosarcina sp. TaxID=2027861 RepID=UPI00356177F4